MALIHTDLATALTNLGAVGFAWAVFGLVLLVWVRRDQKRSSEKEWAPPPVAAEEADTYDLDPSGWVWRDRYQGSHRRVHRTGVVCETKQLPKVEEVARVSDAERGHMNVPVADLGLHLSSAPDAVCCRLCGRVRPRGGWVRACPGPAHVELRSAGEVAR